MLAPSRFDGHWMLLSEAPEIGQRRWIMRDPENPYKYHVKTTSWAPSLIAEANAEMLKASAGQRFGDGKVWPAFHWRTCTAPSSARRSALATSPTYASI
jgi:hypothetical protein